MYEKYLMDNLPSSSALNKAGEIIRKTTDLEKLDKAVDSLSSWRTAHDLLIRKLISFLYSNNVINDKSDFILSSRLKRMPSIIAKIKRLKTRPSSMQDIAGMRIILDTVPQVYNVLNSLSSALNINKWAVFEIVDIYDYIKTPKNDGYRSVHVVLEHNGKYEDRIRGFKIELQIRTKIQHSWSTAVETFDLINNESIKMGKGDQDHRTFFIYASAALSITENMPITSAASSVFKDDIYKTLKELNIKLTIIDILRSMRVVQERISETDYQGNSAYLLLQLNLDRKTVSISRIQKLEEAQEKYKVLEKNVNKENKNWEVVLVSMNEMNQLKKAYPNYFLDASIFIESIDKIINQKKLL